jgi:hypothetical protein
MPKVWQISGAEEPSQNKDVCSQHTKYGTAEPFHFLHMGPMSDVAMSRGLCGADFGHDMSSWHSRMPKVWQISARAKPKPGSFIQPEHQVWHC